ncbi:MAG TPA: hypothetical protein VGF86_04515 [Candidatus Tumulicola sp.]|jgi:hypothetical protein
METPNSVIDFRGWTEKRYPGLFEDLVAREQEAKRAKVWADLDAALGRVDESVKGISAELAQSAGPRTTDQAPAANLSFEECFQILVALRRVPNQDLVERVSQDVWDRLWEIDEISAYEAMRRIHRCRPTPSKPAKRYSKDGIEITAPADTCSA